MGDPVHAYCNVCERGDTVAHPLRQLLPMAWLCDECGRAWQTAAFEVLETGYRRRYPNNIAGCLHEEKCMAGTLDEVTEREAEASTLVKVTTRRRKKP